MVRFISIFVAVLALSACSTMIDTPTQMVTIDTPGVSGALCVMERPGYRARVWTPKTIRITKSGDPIEVTCHAPGNREKVLIVEPEVSDTLFLNIANGLIPGMIVDQQSHAMFKYPDHIMIDFYGMEPGEMPKPDYQEVLDANPMLAGMEEFRSGRPALQRDRYYVAPVLNPRRTDAELFSSGGLNAVHTEGKTVSLGEAGTPESSTPIPPSAGSGLSSGDLTRRMNPQVFDAGGMTGGIAVIGSAGAGTPAAPVPVAPASSVPEQIYPSK